MNRDLKGCKYCSGKQLPEWYVLNKAAEINPNIKLLEPYKKLTVPIKCLCTKHMIETRKTMQDILKGGGCIECGKEKLSTLSFNQITDAQQRVDKINPHVKLMQYNGMVEFANCYCKTHNVEFQKYPATLLHNKSGCAQCYVEQLRATQGLSLDGFKERLKAVHPELNVVSDYVNNSTPIALYCIEHDFYFLSTPAAILSRLVCCDKSRKTYKEEQMCSLLESWGYNIERQKTFDGCRDVRDLAFDAYLVDYNVCCEYDGEQHFRVVTYGEESYEDAMKKLEYTQRHDKIKNKYCKKNHIPLIRIPYWEYENMDYFLFDKLSKLNVIHEISQ